MNIFKIPPGSDPPVFGLYQVITSEKAKFSDDLIARWTKHGWRTVGGRIDGDCRVSDGAIKGWNGPLLPAVGFAKVGDEVVAVLTKVN